VTVSLRHNPDSREATLVIRDNGIGFVDDGKSKRLGIGLVRRLVEQLRGKLEMRSENGTTWTITLSVN
jgi:two-component sensor histidine kinase